MQYLFSDKSQKSQKIESIITYLHERGDGQDTSTQMTTPICTPRTMPENKRATAGISPCWVEELISDQTTHCPGAEKIYQVNGIGM